MKRILIELSDVMAEDLEFLAGLTGCGSSPSAEGDEAFPVAPIGVAEFAAEAVECEIANRRQGFIPDGLKTHESLRSLALRKSIPREAFIKSHEASTPVC